MAEHFKGLMDRHGRPIEKSVLTEEVAGPSITGVRSVITGYPGDGLTPNRLASILREADEGEPLRYFELAEQIEERDLHYAGVMATRKRSVAQIGITVDAASDDKVDVERADMVRDWLDRDELQDELFDILDAIGKGVSMTEINWEVSEGQWRPARLEWRDPRWFRFDRIDGRTPMIRTAEGDKPLPGFKFICAEMRAKSGLPVRSGLARLAAWAWMFKAYTLRDWAIFTQTYGQPVRIGKYGAGATEKDKATLFRAVANIAGDCAAIIPESMIIEFVESKNVGTGSDLYEKRADWYDRQVSKAVLGQTATTDAEVGGLGSGKEHRQVQEDIERADAKSLSAIINRDLIRPWIMLEFGPQPAYPRVKIERAEGEDLELLSNALSRIVPLGLEVSASEVRDRFGFAAPKAGDDILGAPKDTSRPPDVRPRKGDDASPPALQAQEKPQLRAATMIADQMDAKVQPGLVGWLEQIEAMLEKAGSLEELREMLRAAFPDLDTEQLAKPLGEALAVANAAGRFDVEETSA